MLFSAGVSVYLVLKGPGTPGFYELLVHALIAGIFAAVGALLGLFVGWLVCLCVRRK